MDKFDANGAIEVGSPEDCPGALASSTTATTGASASVTGWPGPVGMYSDLSDPSGIADVVSTGSTDHVTTLYRYGSGGPAHVVAEGGWNHTPGFGFRMTFLVVFERATLDFERSRVLSV